MKAEKIMIFPGSGSRRLTQRICEYLNVKPGRTYSKQFSDGNTFVRVQENVRGRRVYLVQSTVFPTNDNFMELLFLIDALKRASAESVTVVMPYFSYAKGDKKDEPRVSIRARVCADAIEAAGADRIVTVDLHSPQIQGFFHIPVDNLYALPVLCDRILKEPLHSPVVVSPDAGFAKQARLYATRLGVPLAVADKERTSHDERASVINLMGDVAGRDAIVVDDFTISGVTLAEVSKLLAERGARQVYAMVTHGVLAKGSIDTIEDSPIRKLIMTDTVENQPVELTDKIEVVSIAPLLGEVVRRIHDRRSISKMFEQRKRAAPGS